MKKLRIVFMSLLVLILALSGFFINYNAGESEYTINARAEKEDVLYDIEAMYMVKEYYGNIGVFIKDEDEYALLSIVDTPVDSLPEADIKSLESGIYLKDEMELKLLLEDFTS